MESQSHSYDAMNDSRSIKKPVVILFDMLVNVDKSILPVDFVVLDCDVNL